MPRKLNKAAGPATGYGNGSVYEESPGSGRWIARLDKTRRRAKSEDEANQKLLRLQQQRTARLQVGKGSQTLTTWYNTWLEVHCTELKQKTREGYAEAFRLWIAPYTIATTRIEELSADHIDRWLAQLKRKGLAPATRAIAFRRLDTALSVAVAKSIIAENPAKRATAPVVTTKADKQVFTEAEAAQFLAAFDGHRLQLAFAMSLTLGLRRGELIGLRWKDIDLAKQTLTVRGQLQWLKVEADKPRRPVWVDSPKSRAGQRTIDLAPELLQMLRTWRKEQAEERLLLGPDWQGGDYVFTSEATTPLHPDNLRRAFKAGLQRAGLPDMPLHDLRHCAGSLMLARGEDIEGVTSVLGHSSRAITEKLYAHALRDRKKRAGESLGFLLRREG